MEAEISFGDHVINGETRNRKKGTRVSRLFSKPYSTHSVNPTISPSQDRLYNIFMLGRVQDTSPKRHTVRVLR